MSIKKLPWTSAEYVSLEPDDLYRLPPTPDQRIRVAAAAATFIRDSNMLGHECPINVEAVRALLVMSDDAWAEGIAKLQSGNGCFRYDPEDPRIRYVQVFNALENASRN